MKVTKNWLIKHNACENQVKSCRFCCHGENSKEKHKMMMRRLDRKDRIRFAVYCAKDVLPIYEAKHSNAVRPHKAIEAAEAWAAADAARAAAEATSNDQSAMSRYIEYGVGLLEGCE